MIFCWPRIVRRALHRSHHRGWQHVHHVRRKAAVTWACVTVGAAGVAGTAGAVIASPWWAGAAGGGAGIAGQAPEIMQVPEPSSELLLLTAIVIAVAIRPARSG